MTVDSVRNSEQQRTTVSLHLDWLSKFSKNRNKLNYLMNWMSNCKGDLRISRNSWAASHRQIGKLIKTSLLKDKSKVILLMRNKLKNKSNRLARPRQFTLASKMSSCQLLGMNRDNNWARRSKQPHSKRCNQPRTTKIVTKTLIISSSIKTSKNSMPETYTHQSTSKIGNILPILIIRKLSNNHAIKQL